MTKMKALILKKGELRLEEIPLPLPARDEALVKVLKCGVCNTDLEIMKGYMDFEGVPGHEFVGQVVESSKKGWQGRRVVGEINIACGHCVFCREGKEKHCPSRHVLGIYKKNGAFAEYLTLPLRNLHFLPRTITNVEAVFVEPLAAALEILEQVRIGREDSVLTLGNGKLGLLAAQVIKTKTDHVFCLGKYERKLEILKGKKIKTFFESQDIKDKFDIVVEATGDREGISEALSRIKPKGKIILKSTYHQEASVDVSKIVVDEIQLIGSRCGPFPKAIALLEGNLVDAKKMVDGDFPLDRAIEAFALAQKPETMKVLITP